MTASTQDGGRLSTREKRLAAAGLAGVALTASALAAEPADAATYTKPYCTGNTLCEFSQGGFANNFARWVMTAHPVPIQNYSDWKYEVTSLDTEKSLNDSISSIWNNTNRWVVLFQNNTYGGHRICFPPGTAVRDLHQVQMKAGWVIGGGGESWGNRISSHWVYGSSAPSDCNGDSAGSTLVPASQQGCSM